MEKYGDVGVEKEERVFVTGGPFRGSTGRVVQCTDERELRKHAGCVKARLHPSGQVVWVDEESVVIKS